MKPPSVPAAPARPTVGEVLADLSQSVQVATQRLGAALVLLPLEPWLFPEEPLASEGTQTSRRALLATTAGVRVCAIGAPALALPPLPVVSLGRSRRAAVQIVQPTISRIHAELIWIGGQFELRDNDSYNGTTLNGRRLAPKETVILVNGDVVALGESQLLFGSLAYFFTLKVDPRA